MNQLAILMLTCGGLASAQTIGLSAVDLTGDPENPTLVNYSSKAIIAAVVVREGSGLSHADSVFFLPPSKNSPIEPGNKTPIFQGPRTVVTRVVNGVPIVPNGVTFAVTTARLDLVVFRDGTIEGQDSYHSDFVDRLKAVVKAGQMALAGQWAELGAMRPGPADDHDLRARAYELVWARNHQGEDAALKLANFYAALPTVLRR